MGHIHKLYDFTVSFYILHPNEAKICLHYHRKLKFWNQLGGHIELDENPLQTIERELFEEAGLKSNDYEIIETTERINTKNLISIPHSFATLVYNYDDSGHKHIDLPYIIQSKTDKLMPVKGESQKIGWFDIEQIKKMHVDGKLQDSTLDICSWVLNHKHKL